MAIIELILAQFFAALAIYSSSQLFTLTHLHFTTIFILSTIVTAGISFLTWIIARTIFAQKGETENPKNPKNPKKNSHSSARKGKTDSIEKVLPRSANPSSTRLPRPNSSTSSTSLQLEQDIYTKTTKNQDSTPWFYVFSLSPIFVTFFHLFKYFPAYHIGLILLADVTILPVIYITWKYFSNTVSVKNSNQIGQGNGKYWNFVSKLKFPFVLIFGLILTLTYISIIFTPHFLSPTTTQGAISTHTHHFTPTSQKLVKNSSLFQHSPPKKTSQQNDSPHLSLSQAMFTGQQYSPAQTTPVLDFASFFHQITTIPTMPFLFEEHSPHFDAISTAYRSSSTYSNIDFDLNDPAFIKSMKKNKSGPYFPIDIQHLHPHMTENPIEYQYMNNFLQFVDHYLQSSQISTNFVNYLSSIPLLRDLFPSLLFSSKSLPDQSTEILTGSLFPQPQRAPMEKIQLTLAIFILFIYAPVMIHSYISYLHSLVDPELYQISLPYSLRPSLSSLSTNSDGIDEFDQIQSKRQLYLTLSSTFFPMSILFLVVSIALFITTTPPIGVQSQLGQFLGFFSGLFGNPDDCIDSFTTLSPPSTLSSILSLNPAFKAFNPALMATPKFPILDPKSNEVVQLKKVGQQALLLQDLIISGMPDMVIYFPIIIVTAVMIILSIFLHFNVFFQIFSQIEEKRIEYLHRKTGVNKIKNPSTSPPHDTPNNKSNPSKSILSHNTYTLIYLFTFLFFLTFFQNVPINPTIDHYLVTNSPYYNPHDRLLYHPISVKFSTLIATLHDKIAKSSFLLPSSEVNNLRTELEKLDIELNASDVDQPTREFFFSTTVMTKLQNYYNLTQFEQVQDMTFKMEEEIDKIIRNKNGQSFYQLLSKLTEICEKSFKLEPKHLSPEDPLVNPFSSSHDMLIPTIRRIHYVSITGFLNIIPISTYIIPLMALLLTLFVYVTSTLPQKKAQYSGHKNDVFYHDDIHNSPIYDSASFPTLTSPNHHGTTTQPPTNEPLSTMSLRKLRDQCRIYDCLIDFENLFGGAYYIPYSINTHDQLYSQHQSFFEAYTYTKIYSPRLIHPIQALFSSLKNALRGYFGRDYYYSNNDGFNFKQLNKKIKFDIEQEQSSKNFFARIIYYSRATISTLFDPLILFICKLFNDNTSRGYQRLDSSPSKQRSSRVKNSLNDLTHDGSSGDELEDDYTMADHKGAKFSDSDNSEYKGLLKGFTSDQYRVQIGTMPPGKDVKTRQNITNKLQSVPSNGLGSLNEDNIDSDEDDVQDELEIYALTRSRASSPPHQSNRSSNHPKGQKDTQNIRKLSTSAQPPHGPRIHLTELYGVPQSILDTDQSEVFEAMVREKQTAKQLSSQNNSKKPDHGSSPSTPIMSGRSFGNRSRGASSGSNHALGHGGDFAYPFSQSSTPQQIILSPLVQLTNLASHDSQHSSTLQTQKGDFYEGDNPEFIIADHISESNLSMSIPNLSNNFSYIDLYQREDLNSSSFLTQQSYNHHLFNSGHQSSPNTVQSHRDNNLIDASQQYLLELNSNHFNLRKRVERDNFFTDSPPSLTADLNGYPKPLSLPVDSITCNQTLFDLPILPSILTEIIALFIFIINDHTFWPVSIYLSICIFVMILEFVVGIFSNSLGLIADAAHMFFDALGIFLSLLSSYLRYRQRAGNYRFSYGYVSIDSIAAAASATLLLCTGIWVIGEALARLFSVVDFLSVFGLTFPGSKLFIDRDNDHNHVHVDSMMQITTLIGLLVNVIGVVAFHHHVHAHGGGGGSCSHNHSHGGDDHCHDHHHHHGGNCNGHDHGSSHHGHSHGNHPETCNHNPHSSCNHSHSNDPFHDFDLKSKNPIPPHSPLVSNFSPQYEQFFNNDAPTAALINSINWQPVKYKSHNSTNSIDNPYHLDAYGNLVPVIDEEATNPQFEIDYSSLMEPDSDSAIVNNSPHNSSPNPTATSAHRHSHSRNPNERSEPHNHSHSHSHGRSNSDSMQSFPKSDSFFTSLMTPIVDFFKRIWSTLNTSLFGNQNISLTDWGMLLHLMADLLGSLALVLSTIFAAFIGGFHVVDPFVSLFIAILIIGSVVPLYQAILSSVSFVDTPLERVVRHTPPVLPPHLMTLLEVIKMEGNKGFVSNRNDLRTKSQLNQSLVKEIKDVRIDPRLIHFDTNFGYYGGVELVLSEKDALYFDARRDGDKGLLWELDNDSKINQNIPSTFTPNHTTKNSTILTLTSSEHVLYYLIHHYCTQIQTALLGSVLPLHKINYLYDFMIGKNQPFKVKNIISSFSEEIPFICITLTQNDSFSLLEVKKIIQNGISNGILALPRDTSDYDTNVLKGWLEHGDTQYYINAAEKQQQQQQQLIGDNPEPNSSFEVTEFTHFDAYKDVLPTIENDGSRSTIINPNNLCTELFYQLFHHFVPTTEILVDFVVDQDEKNDSQHQADWDSLSDEDDV